MVETVIFGLSVSEFEDLCLKIFVTALITYMVFIIANLAHESKAGKTGTIWLFLALGLGMFGFISKSLIAKMLGIH